MIPGHTRPASPTNTMAQQTERFGRDERIHHLKQSNPQRGIHTAPTTPQEITNFNAFQRSVSKAPSSEPRPLTEEMVNSIPASARLAEALRVQREQVQRAQQRGPMTRHVSDYISDKPVHEVDTRRPTSSDSNKVRQMGLREMEQVSAPDPVLLVPERCPQRHTAAGTRNAVIYHF